MQTSALVELRDLIGPIGLILAIAAIGVAAAIAVSARLGWRAAGPLALIIAAPLVPNVDLAGPVSTDDVLPILGLGLLVGFTTPRLALTSNRLLLVALLAVALAIAARIVSTLANADQLPSVLGTLGVAVLRPGFLVAVAAASAMLLPRDRRNQIVSAGLGALGTFEAAFSLTAFLVPLPGLGIRPARMFETLAGCDYRITGTLGLSPNHIGAVFVLTLPFTLALAIAARGRTRWLWVAGAILQVAAVYFTFTRASIALALLAGLAFLLYQRQFRLLVATALGAGALVAAIAFTTCDAGAGQPLPGEPGATETPAPDGPDIVDRFTDPSDRLALWYTAAIMTLDHPATGVGIGRMVEVMRSEPERYVDTPYGRSVSSAHNTILLAGAETGIVGAISMLVLNAVLALAALWLLVTGWRGPVVYSAAGVAIIAFLVQGMVNNLFTVPPTGTLLALIVGVFATARDPVSESSPETTAGH